MILRPSRAIVDYKVAAREDFDARYEWQLRLYSHAARREGWDVRGAYLHAMREGERSSVSLGKPELADAVARSKSASGGIRAGSFPPKPEQKKCAACDYREICGKRATQATGRDVE